MTLNEAIDALEAKPLLGPDKVQANKLAHDLTLRIDPDAATELALRVLIRRFYAQPTTPQSLAQLSSAEAWASANSLTDLTTRIQLIWCAAVGRTHPDAVDSEILKAATAHAEAAQRFPVERLLALAACHPEDADVYLQEVIPLMSEPCWAHLLFMSWLDLAAVRFRGADTNGGRAALESALSVAESYSDQEALITTNTRLGIHLLEVGLTGTAQPHLEAGLASAIEVEDDLHIVILSSLLCAMYIQQDERARAATTADALLISGARRANWFAVVDGHITRSTLLVLDGDTSGAINRLVRAVMHLRELVPAGAINILKGRLAELRYELGASQFDAHYQAAMQSQSAT